MNVRMRWEWTQKWSFSLSFSLSIFVILSNPTLTCNPCSDHHHRWQCLPPSHLYYHHNSVTTCHHHSHTHSHAWKNCEWLQMTHFRHNTSPNDGNLSFKFGPQGRFVFLVVFSFYKLTTCNSLFLGSLLLVTMGADVAQPMPTTTHSSPSKWDVRGLGYALEIRDGHWEAHGRDTHQVSTRKPSLSVPHHWYMVPNQHKTSTQPHPALPARWITDTTSQQWPNNHATHPSLMSNCPWGGSQVGQWQHPSMVPGTMGDDNPSNNSNRWCTTHPQPHEQLLMGWIMGGMSIKPPMMRDTAPTPCLWATACRVDHGCSSGAAPGTQRWGR